MGTDITGVLAGRGGTTNGSTRGRIAIGRPGGGSEIGERVRSTGEKGGGGG